MSVLLSVLTPDFVVHVSDGPNGVPRTFVLRQPGWRGLVTVVGPSDAPSWLPEAMGDRVDSDPATLATWLCPPAGARWDDEPVTVLHAGYGTSDDGRDVQFHYVVTNFEDADAEGPGFTASGAELVPTPARPGLGARAGADRAWRVQVSSTTELDPRRQREIEALPKHLRKAKDASGIAMTCARIVAGIAGDTPVMLAMFSSSGRAEAALLEGGAARPLTVSDDAGLVAFG